MNIKTLRKQLTLVILDKQPCLNIAVLEQELQTQLFIREHRTLTLTKQGKQFYEGMKNIYASYQTLCQNIQQTNTLHIGMKTTDFTDFEILESFEKKYPHLSISYSYLEENELIEGLKAHQLDALISPNMLSFYKNNPIETTTLSKENVSLVCSKELIHKISYNRKGHSICSLYYKSNRSKLSSIM